MTEPKLPQLSLTNTRCVCVEPLSVTIIQAGLRCNDCGNLIHTGSVKWWIHGFNVCGRGSWDHEDFTGNVGGGHEADGEWEPYRSFSISAMTPRKPGAE